MASENLRRRANDYGTEADKATCSFYYKTGTCRHGDKCTRIHDKPSYSRVVIIPNMYIPPEDGDIIEEHYFEDFVEDILKEANKLGTVVELVTLSNTCEHMIGNTYLVFERESQAADCVAKWKDRYYRWIRLQPELSPIVPTFEEARCKQHDKGICDRGGMCNFMHLRALPHWLRLRLYQPDAFFEMVEMDDKLDKKQLYQEELEKRARIFDPEIIDSGNHDFAGGSGHTGTGPKEIRTSAPDRELAEEWVTGAFTGRSSIGNVVTPSHTGGDSDGDKISRTALAAATTPSLPMTIIGQQHQIQHSSQHQQHEHYHNHRDGGPSMDEDRF